VVHQQAGKGAGYVLLDGHIRVEVLRALGRAEVLCLVSTDDENATYNHCISRLAPIQEIRMIQKAVAAGCPRNGSPKR